MSFLSAVTHCPLQQCYIIETIWTLSTVVQGHKRFLEVLRSVVV